MSVKTATDFLLDLSNHTEAPSWAMEATLEGLEELAAELGHEDVTADDIVAAVSDLGGDTDDVEGFAMSPGSVLGGLDLGGISPIRSGIKRGGDSTGSHLRKDDICDCDAD
jgi:hypothetical protein